MHGDLAGELVRAAANLHEHAELVGRRVRIAVDHGAVDRLEARRAGDDDVLAELGCELLTLLVELLNGGGAVALHRLEHLGGEGGELLIIRDGLGLAADGDDDAALAVVGEAIADRSLSCFAAGALGGAREPALAQQRLGGLEIPICVLQRPLAVHHPRARLVAELLVESR